MSELITEPQSDNMTGFNPDLEKIVEQQAGMADGSIQLIQKRVPLTPEELEAIKAQKFETALADLENKLIDGSITDLELRRLDAMYKLKSMK